MPPPLSVDEASHPGSDEPNGHWGSVRLLIDGINNNQTGHAYLELALFFATILAIALLLLSGLPAERLEP